MFGRNKNNITLKKDREVVRSLEDEFFQTLRKVDKKIEEGNEPTSRIGLRYAQRLKEIRGFETVSDRKYSEVFNRYLERFYPEKMN